MVLVNPYNRLWKSNGLPLSVFCIHPVVSGEKHYDQAVLTVAYVLVYTCDYLVLFLWHIHDTVSF